ncbi:acyl-CoA thioesterase [Melioribacter sp. OK-6-Me]|uniref:acyl-CoA thioesterase n=1 Tax=unclassified Melioribacter TaxID=2627329 RepID=UPI003ED85E69
MISFTTEIRVRYADTDKMQFVYNGKYLEYFEVGRTELLRSTGLSYSEVEENGYQLPLIEAKVQYISPARYDDILQITASLNELNSPRVHIEYEIKRKEDGTLIAKGYTTHVFIKTDTKKAVRPPKIYVDALKKYFE